MVGFSGLVLERVLEEYRPTTAYGAGTNSTKLVPVSLSRDPWTDPTKYGPRHAPAPAPTTSVDEWSASRACSIQDPKPSFVSATRGHHDATWRPGAMDADWDEVSRYMRPIPDHQQCFQPHFRVLGRALSTAQRGRPRDHLALRIMDGGSQDCGLRTWNRRNDERLGDNANSNTYS